MDLRARDYDWTSVSQKEVDKIVACIISLAEEGGAEAVERRLEEEEELERFGKGCYHCDGGFCCGCDG